MTDEEWARHRDLTVLHAEFLHLRAAWVRRREELLLQFMDITAAIDQLDREELLRLHEVRRDLEGDEEIYPLHVRS